MNYPYEFIRYNASIPIKLFCLQYPMSLSLQPIKEDKDYVYMPKTQLHWHTEVEIIYVIKGEIKVVCEHQDYLMQKNDLILFNSNALHTTSATGNESAVFICIQMNKKLFEDHCKDFDDVTLKCNTKIESKHSEQDYDLIRMIISRMMLAINNGKAYKELLVESWLSILIYQLLRNFVEDSAQQVHRKIAYKNMERLKRIISHINNNYQNTLTLHEIADSEHLNLHYLSHFINDNLGISFQQYLTDVRFEAVLEKLINTDMKIIDVVYECGFSDVNNFYKLFKKRYGTTPLNYRKKFSATSHAIEIDSRRALMGEVSEKNRELIMKKVEQIQQKYGWINLPG